MVAITAQQEEVPWSLSTEDRHIGTLLIDRSVSRVVQLELPSASASLAKPPCTFSHRTAHSEGYRIRCAQNIALRVLGLR